MQEPLFYDPETKLTWFAEKSGDEYKITKSDIADENLAVKSLNLENTVVIDSINSGTGNQRNLYQQILNPIFGHFDLPHKYIKTSGPETITQLGTSELLVPGAVNTIILISGDTSVNELINGLGGEGGELRLAIIPFGTGNSLSLGLGNENELAAIRKLISPKVRVSPLNLYSVKLPKDEPSYLIHHGKRVKQIANEFKFIVVFSWGFHAALVADSDTEEMRKYGLDRFKMAAMQNLQINQQYEGTTVVKSRDPPPLEGDLSGETNELGKSSGDYASTINGPFAYWVVTPSQKFEPTFTISPNGDLFNSDLYLISFSNSKDILEIMNQVYARGAHVDNSDVTYLQVSAKQTINLKYFARQKNNLRFCVDGAIIEVPESGEIAIEHVGNHLQKWDIFVLN